MVEESPALDRAVLQGPGLCGQVAAAFLLGDGLPFLPASLATLHAIGSYLYTFHHSAIQQPQRGLSLEVSLARSHRALSLPGCNQKLETPVCFPRTVLTIRVAYRGRVRRFHVRERGCREWGLRQLSRE